MRFVRMLIGYLLACVGAAFVLGLFGFAPASIEAFFEQLPDIADKAWSALFYLAAALALFGAVPAIIAFQYAESNAIRTWVYYELIGAAVAMALYWLAHGTETVPVKGDGNVYSTITFGVVGAVLGLLYWLFSGRYAGLGNNQATTSRMPVDARSQISSARPGVGTSKKPATA